MKAPPATAVRVAVTLGVAALALVAAWLLFLRYETRPWTRDGQVRANIVGVAPRVEGPVIRIPVRDNQRVNKGDLLFEIDPATFEAALANARARLEQSLAGVVQTKQELDRQTDLYTKQVNSLRDLQDAQDSYAAAQANADAAKAEVQTAKLNLEYTKVFAPVNGYLTNVQTSPGTYVYAGAQLLALVDADSFWVAAYFKETQLRHIQEGGPVRLTLMGHTRDPFEGVIDSIGWGIFWDTGAASPDLLPAVPQTVDWVRLPQRFPVRVHVTGKPPVPLRIGQTVSVAVAAPGD
jgi:multidrug resistance efflux pump